MYHIVGTEVFRRRAWRAYLWPSIALVGGIALWVIVVFSTFSAMHLLAHAVWAQAAMIVGALQLAVVRGKLTSPRWALVTAGALFASGAAFIAHEQHPWLFSRSAFLHHAIGWTVVVAAIFPLAQAIQPRRPVWVAGFALTADAVARGVDPGITETGHRISGRAADLSRMTPAGRTVRDHTVPSHPRRSPESLRGSSRRLSGRPSRR